MTFTVAATDPEDGALPAAALTTQLVIQHCPGGSNCHAHVQDTFDGVAAAPSPRRTTSTPRTWSCGDGHRLLRADRPTTLRLDPAVVNLTVQTVPAGLQATVGLRNAHDSVHRPRDSAVGQHDLGRVSPQAQGSTYEFESWSDGGARSHTITANGSATYTATFTETAGPPTLPGLVGAWSFGEGTGTTARDSSPTGAHGTLEGGPTWVANGRRGGALSFDGVND